MSTAVVPDREAVFQVVLSRLRDVAPLLHNMWAMLGRGVARDVDELAAVLWYPELPPPKRNERQMRVGAFMSHLNKRVARYGVIIKPGAVKGTYQLYGLTTWQQEQANLRGALVRSAANDTVPLMKRRPRKNAP